MFTDRIYQNILDKPNKKKSCVITPWLFRQRRLKGLFFPRNKVSQQFFEQFHFLRGILIYFWLSRFKGSCGKIDFDLSVTVQVELFGQAQSVSSFLSVGHLAAFHFKYWIGWLLLLGAIRRVCVFDRRVDTQILNSWQTLAGPSFPKVDVHHIIPSRTANWLSVCCVHVYDHSLVTAPGGLVLLLLNATKLGALFSHILRLLTYLLSSFCYMYSEMIQPLSL